MSGWQREYAAYLFDLDGTLVDTAPDINAALNHTLRPLGVSPISVDATRHWVGHGARALLEQALADLEVAHDIASLHAAFLQRYAANIAVLSTPYPTVEATLTVLKQRGAKLAVVTNKVTDLTERLLYAIELRDYFDFVVCGDTAANPKPAADPVALCLKQFAITADQALFVGDSETDVTAAKAAGVDVVCVRDGYNHGIDVTTLDPNGVIDRFDELLTG